MADVVLVLAATGKTRRRLIPKLLSRGVTVRAASRRPAEGRILFDWDRPDTHAGALVGVDAVYLIGPDLVEDPTAVTGHSSTAPSGPASPGSSHCPRSASRSRRPRPGPAAGRLEEQIIASPLKWTILRPTGFAQNFSEGFLAPGIVQAGTLVTATGDGVPSL